MIFGTWQGAERRHPDQAAFFSSLLAVGVFAPPIEKLPDAIGPPPPAIVRQARHVAAIAAAAAVGRKGDELPAGAEEERLHIRLKFHQLHKVREWVDVRNPFAFDHQADAVRSFFPMQHDAIGSAGERPGRQFHDVCYRPGWR